VRLLADLHTHTIASGHGYSTATELAEAARAKGLELIAIIEHGPSVPGGAHPWTLWNMKVIPSVLDGVRILKGVEANPAESESGLDLPDVALELADFVACGMHPEIGYDDGDESRNTEVLLRVIENPNVDMITHPGGGEFPVDRALIARAAAEHNVIIEINAHSFDPTGSRAQNAHLEREMITLAHAAGAPLAIGSDAHYHLHVGRFDAAIRVAQELGITEEHLVNRDARSVLAHLVAKRDRPRLDYGGVWETTGPDGPVELDAGFSTPSSLDGCERS
jgi:putative hydrolase